jgi:hypothetical protein
MGFRKRDGSAFILWSDYYDDLLAALFAISLREAGWRTRLVGLRGAAHKGRHGLCLVADVSVGQALLCREPLVCVVAPCAPEQINTYGDARLGEFLGQARRQGALFVAKPRLSGEHNPYWPDNGHTATNDPEEVLTLLHLVIAQLEKIHLAAPQ